jgi:osmotically-inducible protein OsmY
MTRTSAIKSSALAISSFALLGLAACDRPANPTGANNSSRSNQSAPPSTAQRGNSPGAQEQPSKASTGVDDSAITAAVKAGIMAEPGLKVLKIDVDTREGRVTLTGSADSAENVQKAEQVASNVNGVKGVENRLTVEKG